MPARSSYDYALLRVAPRVERGECLNVGVLVFCRARSFLAARIELDEARLTALFPFVDLPEVRAHLAVIPLVCAGGKAAGPLGGLSQTQRFHWLVAPRSTIVQPSPAHSGLCFDPQAALDQIFDAMVRVPTREDAR